MTTSIAFIGLGLIGGSLAKAIRRAHPEYCLMAYDTDREALALALSERVIDIVCSEKDLRVAKCRYIFLCAPVEYNIEYLEFLKEYCQADCIISDVGSVKGPIHHAVRNLGLEPYFIGGHPMAGSERSGYRNSGSGLLENAYFLLTPEQAVPQEKIGAYRALVSSFGSLPLILTPEQHDYITAGVSHIPHIIAASLVNLVRTLDDDEQHMKRIAAGGFRDITRIASSSPLMWEQICCENADNISAVLDAYIRLLRQARAALDTQDAASIRQIFTASKDYRDSMDIVTKGALHKVYMIYLDIADEAGGIATIATILAMANISIKNIGIIHNREFEQGVLKIEFYQEEALTQAAALLKKRNYTVYER